MRAKAIELGFSNIEAFATYNREHPEARHDVECDMMISKFAEHDYVICEGRLPHAFMPCAFHVLLVCDIEVRANRRQGDFPNLSKGATHTSILKRDDDDEARYGKLYPGTNWPQTDFDLVVDTAAHSKRGVSYLVLDGHCAWLIKKGLKSV